MKIIVLIFPLLLLMPTDSFSAKYCHCYDGKGDANDGEGNCTEVYYWKGNVECLPAACLLLCVEHGKPNAVCHDSSTCEK